MTHQTQPHLIPSLYTFGVQFKSGESATLQVEGFTLLGVLEVMAGDTRLEDFWLISANPESGWNDPTWRDGV